jgi:para-nitrobenzyl esterase
MNVTSFGPRCIQAPLHPGLPPPAGSEDCLQLNVYVPEDIVPSSDGPPSGGVPVVVFLHGGGLVFGCGYMHARLFR